MNEHLKVDPYNFKFPSRKDLMSLNKIDPLFDSQKRKLDYSQKKDNSLNTNDIKGAQSYLKGYKFKNKEEFQNKTKDIPGATASSFYNKRMRTEQEKEPIEGTIPQINKFVTKRPSTNPLEPVYKLQSYTKKECSPAKFIKDPLRVDDIEGTRSKWLDIPQLSRKTIYIGEEIEGSRTKQIWVPKDRIDVLDVKDINQYLQFTSNRQVDPLQPTYCVRDQGLDVVNSHYGYIQGSQSRQLHPKVVKFDKNYSLKTKDIEGAQHGTLNTHFLNKQNRKQFRNINQVDDIPGAQFSTLKKGIQTNRNTNPNNPKYKYLSNNDEQTKNQQKIDQLNNNYKYTAAQKLDKFIN